MPHPIPLLTVAIHREQDILLARQRSRQISQFLGFSDADVARITTALSEIARNAFEYGGGGSVAFSVVRLQPGRQELRITVRDNGPGIPDAKAVLSPGFRSRTGLGLGIKGSRVLMDRFDLQTGPGEGTSVVMAKSLPLTRPQVAPADVANLMDEMAKAVDASPLGELQQQNQLLLNTLEEVSRRQIEIERLSVVAEEARQRAEAALLVAEHATVVRERFMALTTHELRTPLNAIIGYLELLEMELASAMSEKQKEYFTRVQRAARHLLGVTNDFLVMAQGDAGELKVTRHEGAARHVISEASMLVTPQAVRREVAIHLVETSEHVTYLGDVARVRQVLVNVLGNAVSFTPPGGTVQVVASLVAEAPAGTELVGGPWCVIRVEDSGPGIPSDKLAHVFEPFVQLSPEGHAARKGSGLGLTVSRQLALLMGGDLTVESNGQGAEFSIWLAAGPQAAAANSASGASVVQYG